mmetsp:Transcript_12936/g.23420  ORF Transcript_12936/g.23420 Transcript_12936/m.23420 type:complete len:82 (-) Transcript_12936:163-408(-)
MLREHPCWSECYRRCHPFALQLSLLPSLLVSVLFAAPWSHCDLASPLYNVLCSFNAMDGNLSYNLQRVIACDGCGKLFFSC